MIRRLVSSFSMYSTALLVALASSPALAQFVPVGSGAFRNGSPNAGRLSEVVPLTATQIFVAASDGGVWRTLDGGTNWDTRTDKLSSTRISALAADSTGMRIYAATHAPVRLLKSTDGGNSFSELTIPQVAFAGDFVWELIVDPVHANTIYAVTTRGLLRSQNDGGMWDVVLPPDTSFVLDAALLAGSQFWILAARGDTLYRSSTGDPGSFSAVTLPPPTDGQPPFGGSFGQLVLAAVPGMPNRVYIAYAGFDDAVYRTDDFGASAAFLGRHPRPVTAGRFAASADGTTVYSGEISSGNASLNRGRNGGTAWDIPWPGAYHADVHAVTTTAGGQVYVGTDGGIWRYNESTDTWDNLNGNLANLLLYQVFASRGTHDAIVGGTQDNGVIIWRGTQWAIGGGGDVGDGFLRRDDPNVGGAFTVISGSSLLFINGDSAVLSIPPDSLPCPRPTGGSFGLDPATPTKVCVATDKIQCSLNGGRDPWCVETSEMGVVALRIVNATHAWATTLDHRVLRTTTGVTGSWVDVTSDLPAGSIIGIDAPENGSPLRALVLIAASGSDPLVYETTDGGANWDPRGVPPVIDAGGIPAPCFFPPCPDTPEHGPMVTSFAVTFPGFLRGETWYVGTYNGLLGSTDSGATWLDTNLPNVFVRDLDTYDGVTTIGTWGRGVWQRVIDFRPPFEEFLAFDPFWWIHHNPVEIPDLWASDVIVQSNDVIQELRLLGGGGRTFRRDDAPRGPNDFRVTAGAPFLVRGDVSDTLALTGPLADAQPIALLPGWNPVGILDPDLRTASALVADAALQSIRFGAVLDGGAEQSYVPGLQEATQQQDFPILPADGYWVYACGEGGVWTPGAGSDPGGARPQSRADVDAPPSIGAAVVGNSAASPLVSQQTCANPEPVLAKLADYVAERVPAEFLACLPQQEIFVGNSQLPLCDTPPAMETDTRFDNTACDDQPQSRGCAITIRIHEILQIAAGELQLLFDAEANGTGRMPDGASCPVNASVSDSLLLASIGSQIDPPAIDLSVGNTMVSGPLPFQQGCGDDADRLIADLVATEIQRALTQELALRIGGLGLVCPPELQLPDADADGTFDCDDGCPSDPNKIDPGACGCGIVDDFDGDGFVACGEDCNDSEASIWSVPGEVLGLMLAADGASPGTILSWMPPTDPGANSVSYDVLSTFVVGDFDLQAGCVESDDDSDTTAVSTSIPDPGRVEYFAVRAQNRCPNGEGTLGSNSDGEERQGRGCP